MDKSVVDGGQMANGNWVVDIIVEPAARPSDWLVAESAPEREPLERVERRVEDAMIEATENTRLHRESGRTLDKLPFPSLAIIARLSGD